MKIFRFLAIIAVLLLGTAGVAAAEESDTGTTGALTLKLVDGSGAFVSGACFELYSSSGGSYGLLLDTFCNVSGTSARWLPEGSYILREVQPPLLRLAAGGTESHVYRKAPDAHFGISALLPANVTIEHEIGAAVDVFATLPDGQAATGSCFVARGFGSSDSPAGAGPIVDQACTGTGATAKLYVGPGEHAVSQISGPSGFAFAPDARVTAVADTTAEVELRMRSAAVLRVEQRAAEDGRLIEGGCYSVFASPTGGVETFADNYCDGDDAEGTDGVVAADDLQPGRYRLHEHFAPKGFELSAEDAYVVLDRSDVTIARPHVRLPYVFVTTTDAGTGAAVAGSCWRVRPPGDKETIIAEACDRNDGQSDGRTKLVVVPGQWELVHTLPPSGYSRAATTPVTVAHDDLELSFALTGPQKPASVTRPTIAGTPHLGAELLGDRGTWTGATPIGYAYRWERCSAAGDGCAAIDGAVQASYAPAAGDLGSALRLAVTATNFVGATVAYSVPTPPVAGDPPVDIEPPTITGKALVGAPLTAAPGWWAGAQPIAFSYQWQRCDASGESCVPIADATAVGYVTRQADHHTTLRVTVTATNVDGTTTVRSAATSLLLAPPYNAAPPLLSREAEPPYVGRTIQSRPGLWIGAQPLETAPQWLRCDATGEACTEIPGATDWSYTPAPDDLAARLRLEVRGTNVDGSTVARTPATPAVLAVAPLNQSPPFVLGDLNPLHVESDLVGRAGTWVGTAPIDYAPQWLRCDRAGEACVEIPGAADWAYHVTHDDVRHSLRLRVTATNIAGSVAARSAPVGYLDASPPHNVSPPWIRGYAYVGVLLTGMSGEWTGARPLTYSPQWLRCDTAAGGCDEIAGATDWTFRPTSAERGFAISLAVTATNIDGTTTARSSYTGIVPGAIPGPTNLAAPAIFGANQMRLGAKLVGHAGTWTGTGGPITYAAQWLRCDENGDLCTAVAGATTWSYVLGEEDVRHTLRLEVAATNAQGTTRARSIRTPLLPAYPPVNVQLPRITGSTHVGSTLTGQPGTWAGTNPIAYAPRWLRCDWTGDPCVAIPGGTNWEYVITAADAGKALRLEVTATNVEGARAARSQPLRIF